MATQLGAGGVTQRGLAKEACAVAGQEGERGGEARPRGGGATAGGKEEASGGGEAARGDGGARQTRERPRGADPWSAERGAVSSGSKGRGGGVARRRGGKGCEEELP